MEKKKYLYQILRWMVLALSLFGAVTVVIYLICRPDGVLFNVFANVWLLTIFLGMITVMLNRGPAWIGIVYAVVIGIYFAVHSLFTYAGTLVPDYGSNLYLISSGGNLLIVMIAGILLGLLSGRQRKKDSSLHPVIRWIGISFFVLATAAYTYLAMDAVGFVYIEAVEYLEFFWLYCGFSWINCVFGIRLLQKCNRAKIRYGLTSLFAILAVVNVALVAYQIDTSFAAARANEAELNGLRFSDVRLDGNDGDSGRRGLYEEMELESDSYPAPLSLAMMLCGNYQEKDDMVITYNAGNWHENTEDGVVLYYDVYAPANASEKTPVVINLHGYAADRAWVDTYALFCGKGYTVLDVEYGMDSETKNSGTVNSPNGMENRADNYDYWVQDMEHLFRYLKQHEDELNIDLTNVILYGHSGGCYMAVGMDNMLLGAGFEDCNGQLQTTSYNRYAQFYTEDAASENVSDFVDIRGMVLLYGVCGRYFADGLDPILFSTGTTDGVVTFESARQIYKLRATNDMDHFYILDAGLGSHGFDGRASYELYNQLTNRGIELFINRFSIQN